MGSYTVLTILAAGTNGKLDESGLDLKKGYGFEDAADNGTAAISEYMAQDSATQQLDMAFVRICFCSDPGYHWFIKLRNGCITHRMC
ncbi:unnamed protein product [Rhizoctonia solani]|uniref:Uncharacterized protein n=1 Tax=Rhizoctonia solani TaxID=456999 RepID=A0A8H3BGD9_9AGAM|nr:unnamed protein product [Rhizoctonia solani]